MCFPSRLIFLFSLLLGSVQILFAERWKPAEGQELIGTPAPTWEKLTWLGSEPLSLEQLRGKVILLRFWTAGCALCRRTIPALNYFHERYAYSGLVVVGIHHPKERRYEKKRNVEKVVKELTIAFPVGLDTDWDVVNRYWLSGHKRQFTSASFLIDKQGIIRFVHDGGEFHSGGGPEHTDCRRAFETIEKKIQELLVEPSRP